jgi:hypothetical protein
MACLTEIRPAAKQCKACGLELPLGFFTPAAGCKLGVLPRCKSCMRVASAEYRDQHPEIHREACARWRASNPEKQRDACRRHYQANKGYYAEKNARWQNANPDKCREYSALHYARDPDRCREVWRNHYHRTKLQPLKVIRRRVTSRMHAFLSGLRSGFMREIGCSAECLKQHLELLFPEGMGWHNSDGWEIDHFYPLSAIGDDPSWIEVAAVCNYRNLRPVWKCANRSKRARVLPEAERLFMAIQDLILVGKQ